MITIRKSFQYGLSFVGAFILILVFSFFGDQPAHAEEISKTESVSFQESTIQNQFKTLTIPNLINVEDVSVDNGVVEYSVNDSDITLNVSKGNGKKVQTGGSFTPSDSKTVTDSKSTKAGESASTLPSSINYNSGGYTGTLAKNGSATVTSGSYTPANSKTVTDSKSTSAGGNASTLPTSISYSSGGYVGTLTKNGSAKVTSGSYTPASTKTVSQNKSAKFVCSWYWTGTTWDPDGNWTIAPPTVKYSSGGYTGTLSYSSIVDKGTCTMPPKRGTKVGQVDKSVRIPATVTYKGSVTKPASKDTRVWTQNYKGTVIKPASKDTRVWTQNYKGTVTKPEVDTRTYETRYSYVVTIRFRQEDIRLNTVPSDITLTPVTLDGTAQQVEKSISEPVIITDAGETGWHLTISATPFKNENGNVLPQNSLQMATADTVKIKNLNNNEKSTKPLLSKQVSIDGSAHTIASIEPTSEISQYIIDDFKLRLLVNPGTTFVDQSNKSSAYQSTITWTIVSGP